MVRGGGQERAGRVVGGCGCFQGINAKIHHGSFVYHDYIPVFIAPGSASLRYKKTSIVALGCGRHLQTRLVGMLMLMLTLMLWGFTQLYSRAGDAHPPQSSRAAHRLVSTRAPRTRLVARTIKIFSCVQCDYGSSMLDNVLVRINRVVVRLIQSPIWRHILYNQHHPATT